MTGVAPTPMAWRAPSGAPEVSGALVVGVGGSDLDLRSGGLHHLVEHLVMNRVGNLPCSHNAVSTSDCVVFHATGSQDEVVEFLTAVLAAITSLRGGLTARELELEQNILATEFVGRGGGRMGPWTVRYGVEGVGLLDQPEVGAGTATVEDVHMFMDRWFVADNARLVLTFDPGHDVAVDLPKGQAPRAVRWQARPESLRRGYAVTETDGVTLSFEGHEALGDMLVLEILRSALRRELRHENGLVYSVDMAVCATGLGRRVAVFSLDPLPEVVDVAAHLALTIVERVATGGPTEEVLEESRQGVLAQLDSSSELINDLLGAAIRELRDDVPADMAETRRAVERMTAAEVRDRLADLAQTLVLTVPEGAATQRLAQGALAHHRLPRLHLFDTDDRAENDIGMELLKKREPVSSHKQVRFRPTRGYYPKVFGPVRGVHLWIGPGQLTIFTRGEPAVIVDARDVVATETYDDGSVFLLTRRGGRLTVNPRHFRGARRWWPHFAADLRDDILRQ